MTDITGTHFYNKITRKLISVFGSIFNNLTIVRYGSNGTTELERFVVPIDYAEKEKFIWRLRDDPDLDKGIGITLPRISYSLESVTFNPERAQEKLLKHQNPYTNTAKKYNYIGAPYDLVFELTVATRNMDDALQIVEQIFPLFIPDYTVSVNLLSEIGKTYDIPITLVSNNKDVEYLGKFESTRFVTWTFRFVMNAYYISRVREQKIIKTAFANTYMDPSIQTGYVVQVNVNNGNNGTFKIQDVVYQGKSQEDAYAIGLVIDWSSNNSILRIGAAQGTFVTNSYIEAVSTNASYNLVSFHTTPLKLTSLKVQPNPTTANSANESHGFTETWLEFPETLD